MDFAQVTLTDRDGPGRQWGIAAEAQVNFVFKMMNFVFKMMNFVLKMLGFVLRMLSFCITNEFQFAILFGYMAQGLEPCHQHQIILPPHEPGQGLDSNMIDFVSKMMDFVSKMLDSALTMMDFVSKMMDHLSQMMDYALKTPLEPGQGQTWYTHQAQLWK